MHADDLHALRVSVFALSKVFAASGNNKKWVRFITWDTRDLSLELCVGLRHQPQGQVNYST